MSEDWRNRSLYLPHLFLALVLPWGAFVLLMLGQRVAAVQYLFVFYIAILFTVFGVGILLIKERASPALYRFARMLPVVAAAPALVAVVALMVGGGPRG